MAEPKSYTLKTSITFGSQTISSLTFRKPRAGDVRDFPLNNPKGGDIIDIAGKMCGQPPAVMDLLEIEDVVGVSEVVLDFLPDGLLTGLTSSRS